MFEFISFEYASNVIYIIVTFSLVGICQSDANQHDWIENSRGHSSLCEIRKYGWLPTLDIFQFKWFRLYWTYYVKRCGWCMDVAFSDIVSDILTQPFGQYIVLFIPFTPSVPKIVYIYILLLNFQFIFLYIFITYS